MSAKSTPSSAIDLVLSRVTAKANGKDRWRCSCPVCGEKNKTTLSIGIGDNGAVLLTCFKNGCGPDEIASALGLEITDLFPPRESFGKPLKRRRMLSDSQALEMLDKESRLLWIVGSDWVRGNAPDELTLQRVVQAVARIGSLRQEVFA